MAEPALQDILDRLDRMGEWFVRPVQAIFSERRLGTPARRLQPARLEKWVTFVRCRKVRTPLPGSGRMYVP